MEPAKEESGHSGTIMCVLQVPGMTDMTVRPRAIMLCKHRSVPVPRVFSSIRASVTVSVVLAVVAACGSAAPQTVSVPKLKPQAGHVIINPNTALSFLYLPRSVVKESNGDLLITDGGNWDRSGAKVVEMNSRGKVVWEYTGGLVFPHAAYPAGKNDILISDTSNDRVIEINRKGKTVWNTDNLGGGRGYLGAGRLSNGARLLYPNDAVPMANGRILISSRFTNTVYEINKSGKVIWSCGRFMFRQHNPRLLPNGNLMVADSDNARVLIINHACNKILFDYGGTDNTGSPNIIWPRSFQLYPGGNYVIGDSLHNRIIEINPHKHIVRQWTGLPEPFYITVLPNGDLLSEDTNINGAVELGARGGIVRVYSTKDPYHYPSSIVNGGFEKFRTAGWHQGDLLTETAAPGQRADMYFDTSVHHSGRSSGRITWNAKSSHLPLFWFQNLSVTPGQTYHFEGWIKTQNVQSCSGCDYGAFTVPYPDAGYTVSYFKPGDPYNPPAGPFLGQVATGTQGWTREVGTFTTPPGVTQVQIKATLYGKGTVWFDDVSVK